MEYITTSLTNEQIDILDFLGDFYGEKNRAVLLKLALVKFDKEHFAEDTVEYGLDEDLEKIRGE